MNIIYNGEELIFKESGTICLLTTGGLNVGKKRF